MPRWVPGVQKVVERGQREVFGNRPHWMQLHVQDPTFERQSYPLPYGGPNLCGICYSDHRICHCLQGKEYLMIRAYCGRGHFGQLFVDEDGELTCLTCGWRPEPSPPPDKLENSRVRATDASR